VPQVGLAQPAPRHTPAAREHPDALVAPVKAVGLQLLPELFHFGAAFCPALLDQPAVRFDRRRTGRGALIAKRLHIAILAYRHLRELQVVRQRCHRPALLR
jgi:hypothetical protein